MSPQTLYQCDIQRKGANELTFGTLFQKSQIRMSQKDITVLQVIVEYKRNFKEDRLCQDFIDLK